MRRIVSGDRRKAKKQFLIGLYLGSALMLGFISMMVFSIRIPFFIVTVYSMIALAGIAMVLLGATYYSKSKEMSKKLATTRRTRDPIEETEEETSINEEKLPDLESADEEVSEY